MYIYRDILYSIYVYVIMYIYDYMILCVYLVGGLNPSEKY